jgi:hypothetical protein
MAAARRRERALGAIVGAAALLITMSPWATSLAEEGCALHPAEAQRDRIVEHYAPTLLSCSRDNERDLAIRTMRVDGQDALLLVAPDGLATRIEKAECWRCAPTSDAAEANTRLMSLVHRASSEPGHPLGAARLNAGLTSGAEPGTMVTADLCPSRRPLDRGILEEIAEKQRGAPVGLSITGSWLRSHRADFAWLEEREAAGDFAITWINHTDRHRYVAGLKPDENFMLLPGTDPQREILEAERQLIAAGGTPSVFFRFPGLVSTPALEEMVAADHLVTLGARLWVAAGSQPRSGDILLFHANGNEEAGVRRLAHLLADDPELMPLKAVGQAR